MKMEICLIYPKKIHLTYPQNENIFYQPEK